MTLTASVTSGNVTPSTGKVTFIVTNGTSMIGNPVTQGVNSSGVASTSILLPAGTLGGTDTIVAIYDGTASYLGSIDASHTITVSPATTTSTAKTASDTYSAVGAQTVNLSATVSSTNSNGAINEGTETFTILAGSTPLGPAVTVRSPTASPARPTRCPPARRSTPTPSRPSTAARPTSSPSPPPPR